MIVAARPYRSSKTSRRTLRSAAPRGSSPKSRSWRSEEHTSELQSRLHLVCRLLLEKKKKNGIDAFLRHPARTLERHATRGHRRVGPAGAAARAGRNGGPWACGLRMGGCIEHAWGST